MTRQFAPRPSLGDIEVLWRAAVRWAKRNVGKPAELEYTSQVFLLDNRPVQARIRMEILPVEPPPAARGCEVGNRSAQQSEAA